MKTSVKVVIGVAVAAGLAFTFAAGPILKAATLRALKQSTGMEISYAKMEGNPWRRTLDIDGLVFKNPPDFPETEAIEISHLHAQFRWRDLLGDAVKLEVLQLDIPRVVMVRKADGDTNLQRMQDHAKAQRKAAAKGASPAPAPAAPPADLAAALETNAVPEQAPAPAEAAAARAKAPQPELSIGSLALKLGKVEIHDYGRMKDGKPRRQAYDLNVERTFQDVTDLDAVGQELAAQVLIQEGLRAVNEQLKDPEAMDKLGKKLEKALGKFLK